MCLNESKPMREAMTRRSTRTKSIGKLEQSIDTLGRAADQFDDAMTPYFEAFPEKREITDMILVGMKKIKGLMESSLDDI